MKIITLHYPSKTLPLSVTGKECRLNCKHCGGFYLGSMKKPADAFTAPKNSLDNDVEGNYTFSAESSAYSSMLVSGGCNPDGAVPLCEHIDELKKLKEAGFRLNLHTGLIPIKYIPEVASLADVISFDFITHDETIREVYGSIKDIDDSNHSDKKSFLKKPKNEPKNWVKGNDYIKTYIELKKWAEVVPHITIGLWGGQIAGEFSAVDKLNELGCEKIVFLVFMPTKGTFYEDRKPPGLSEVEKVFLHTRKVFPDLELGLGCMHPRGVYKYDLEMIAFKYDFSSYVNPSKRFRLYLEQISRQEKLEIIIDKECCALC